MKIIGVLAHPLREPSFSIAQQIHNTLQERGLESWVFTRWEAEEVTEHVSRSDLVIAIGGDGAMLRAARVCAPYNVPVLGINMGQLGFLTEIPDPDNWEPRLDAVLRGEYWIESRTMIRGTIERGDEVLLGGDALNDIVISGSTVGRTIQLETYIDNDWTTTYYADALVIATATGSTAYALACGGPILPPELSNILIVPAAPHLSMSRPIVLSEGAKVDVTPSAVNQRPVLLIADGMVVGEVSAGDRVCIRVSDHISRFIRLRERNYFYRSLLDRLEPRVQRDEKYK